MKLGLLLPTSKLYPSLMIDFSAGVRMAISEHGLDDDIEIIFENIHQGTDKNLILNAVNKLVLQHQTEVNILFANFLLMEDIASSLNALSRPLLVTNMGGNIPNQFESGDFIFSNSFALWESAHLAGVWGAKKFGKKVAHGSYFYEAGYGIYRSFCEGLKKSEGEIIFNQVSEFNPDPNDFSNFMKQMQVETPDFLYMLYSERDAVDFLNKLTNSEYNGKYPIVTSGVMLNDEITSKVDKPIKKIYNISSWDASDKTEANQKFVQKYKKQTGNYANYFALLGYECATAVCEAFKSDNWSKNGGDQATAIRSCKFESPRGELSFAEFNMVQVDHHVYTIDENHKRSRMETIGQLPSRTEGIEASKLENNPAGWFQPYLCQ